MKSKAGGRRAIAAMVLAAGFVGGKVSAQTNVTWLPGTSGNWSAGASWTGGTAPNNGIPVGSTYNVFIDGGQAANVAVSILASQSFTVSGLSISAGDQLNINANGILNLAGPATISNAGTIALGSVGTLNFNLGTVMLNGGGTITMNNSRLLGTGTLHNVDNRIIGNGSFGANVTSFINNATISINGATTIDPGAGGFANTGLLEATAGTLTLSGVGGGAFTNTGGTIAAQNGATIALSASITGGTITTAGTGIVVVPAGSDGTFSGISNYGNITSLNSTNTGYDGAILNNGSININPTASLTDLQIDGTTSFSGSGTVSLNSQTVRVVGGGTLTNATTHTIRGIGALGANNVFMTNHGKILADIAAGTLTIDPIPVAGAFTNNGTLQASNGATLSLSGTGGGDFINSGVIEALNASTISIANGTIAGGTFSSAGTGIVAIPAGNDGTFSGITNVGNITSGNSTNTYYIGSIVNTGSISIVPTSSLTDLEIPGATTFSSTGTIVLSGTTVRVQGGGTLTNSSTHTIRGFGGLGMNDLAVVNDGRIIADGGALVLDPKPIASAFINNGTLQALAGATFTFSGLGGGDFVNNGYIQGPGGATISLVTNATISGGTLNVVGIIPAGNDGTLSNITNLLSLASLNATNFTLIGNIVNAGSISVIPTVSLTDLEIPLATNLNGSGTLNLDGATVRVQGGGTLTNSSTHTIRGIAGLGMNDLAIVNNGTITNNYGSGTLTIDPSPTGHFINNGSVRVTTGGTVDLSGAGGGTFGGSGGYNIGAGATLRSINSAAVSTGNIVSNGTLIVSGTSFDTAAMSGPGIVSVTAGTMSAASIVQGTLSIAAGRSVSIRPNGTVAGSSRVDTLTLTATSKLDINNNALIVDYTGATPFASIRSSLFTGYAGGAWTGNGIISTSAASDPRFAIAYIEASSTGFSGGFRGLNYLSDAVLLMYTYRGDVNLDRKVDSTDFSAFLGAYGTTTNANWAQGDFDYNGKVNTLDFNWLAGNFGQSLPAAGDVPSLGAVVPEPGSIAAVGIAAAGLLRRNRRR